MLKQTEGYGDYAEVDDVGGLLGRDASVLRFPAAGVPFSSDYAVLGGTPDQRLKIPGQSFGMNLVHLENVVYFGNRLFLSIGRDRVPLGVFRRPKAATAEIDLPDLPADLPRINGVTYSADTRHSGHGHLLTEALSQMWGASHVRPDRIIVNKKAAGYFAPLMACLFDAPFQRFKNPVVLDHLVLATPSYVGSNYISEQFVANCQTIRDMLAPQQDPRPLYVSRRFASKRLLLNEEDVEQIFADRGFRILYPERTDLREQIQAFADATMVAGPVGSALYNIVFSRLRPKRLILAPANFHTNNDLMLGAFTGSAPNYVFGSGAGHSRLDGMMADWTIDLEAVRRAVAGLVD